MTITVIITITWPRFHARFPPIEWKGDVIYLKELHEFSSSLGPTRGQCEIDVSRCEVDVRSM